MKSIDGGRRVIESFLQRHQGHAKSSRDSRALPQLLSSWRANPDRVSHFEHTPEQIEVVHVHTQDFILNRQSEMMQPGLWSNFSFQIARTFR